MSSVNYSQLIPNSANLSWFYASSRVGNALGIAPLWEGRGAFEYLQAEQRDWDAGAFDDAGRGARAQEVRCLPHNPSCNPRQKPDVGKAHSKHPSTPPHPP